MSLFASVRFRAAAAAAAVVAVALVVAAFALVTLTRRNLTESARDDALATAASIAELAAGGVVVDPLPSAGPIFGQLIGPDGTVVAATQNVDIDAPITQRRVADGERVVYETAEIEDSRSGDLGGSDGRFTVAVVGVSTATGPSLAVGAASLADIDRAIGILVPLLVIGLPLLAALVFALAWRLVGRSLAPMEAMRREAEAISITDLGRRLPQPSSHDEVGRLSETLNSMLERLEQSVARQRQFVADASHELKSPVASLVTMAEVAIAAAGAIPVDRLAADVGIEANRLALLTDDLLALAKSDEGALGLHRERIDVAQLVLQEVHRLKPPIDVGGVHPVYASVDRLRLGQAIRNLLDNALRHAVADVWVTCHADGGDVVVMVADDGDGVPVADRDRIFERFERLDEARSRSDGGSGLGLAVVRTIVEAHGGAVNVVDASAFPGAAFEIRVPDGDSASSQLP